MNDLRWLSAREICRLVRGGEVTRREVLEAALRTIDDSDDDVGCFLYVNSQRALAESDDADAGEGERGALDGVPVAFKDNICTQQMPTTCASAMLASYHPLYSATAVEALEEAGAISVGKTNMDEFAMGSSTESSSVQLTRNPWDPDRVPGGSSGGSTAAVAAGQVPVALGSDTGGSIRQPAAFCGVVGMKPTYGAVSRYGLIAFASSLDQIGPITRDVVDCAAVMDVLVGDDPSDSTSVSHPDAGGFLQAVEQAGDDLRGVRIGLPQEYLDEGIDPGVRRVVLDAAETFSQLGASVQECSLPSTGYALPAYYIISSAEASSNLARFDGVRYGLRETGAEMMDIYRNTRGTGFGSEVKRRIMLGTFVLSAGFYEAYYVKAARARALMVREMLDAFEQFDLLLAPTGPTVAFAVGARSDDPLSMYMADVCTIPANLAGIPAVSIPGGFSEGMPVGVQLMGPRFGDARVLAAAGAFQRATDHHLVRPPLADPAGGSESM